MSLLRRYCPFESYLMVATRYHLVSINAKHNLITWYTNADIYQIPYAMNAFKSP